MILELPRAPMWCRIIGEASPNVGSLRMRLIKVVGHALVAPVSRSHYLAFRKVQSINLYYCFTNMALNGLWVSQIPKLATRSLFLTQCSPNNKSLLLPIIAVRYASGATKHNTRKDQPTREKKKRKARTTFLRHNLKDAQQFALCDAMR